MQAYASSIQMDIPGVELLDVSAVIDDNLTRDGWVSALREVDRLAKASPWWLGDLFIGGQSVWGKGYAKVAAAEAGVTPGTVATYASVSRNVPPEIRRVDLSHAHHALVARYGEADQVWWLEYAACRDLRVEEFRRALGRGRKPAPPAGEPSTSDGLDKCPTCGRPLS
jgi:hypothetical protein